MLAKIENNIDTGVQRYIDGVLDGSIVACKYTKQAVQRHLNDIEKGEERGLFFDSDAASIALDFFPILRHSKGRWAKQRFELSDWQRFIIWNLFGWKNADGFRRFRIAYNEVARKNGKSTFAAGIGLLALIADGENGAEVYSAATKLDQAKIIHDEAIKMVRKSKDLQKYLQIYINNIVMPSTESKFAPLGADAKTLDGLNPHFATIDEFHAHKSSEIWDVLRSALGSRTQPMIFAITTAGFNINGICHDQHDYAIKILDGIIEDDTFFAFICTLDDGDDWKDESVWGKANPNLGITVSFEDMRQMCKKAIESPAELNNFLCKKLNVWTTQETKFFNMEKWNACNRIIGIETLKGTTAYQAIDLSSKIDICAKLLLFELENGFVFALPKFYCPKNTAIERSREDNVPYLKWAEQGYIILTPGDVVDYDILKADIKRDWSDYSIKAMAYDPWNFESIRQDLIRDGIHEKSMLEFSQTLRNMTAPTKELEKLVVSGKLIHNNNPVLTWMASNTAVYMDANENIRPVKNKSAERIDGIVAMIMALGLKLIQPQKKPSIYEDRGILEL